MPAQGKTNASRVQVNDRIIVRVAANGTVWESTTKTGEGVQVARVTGKVAVQGGRTATGRGTSRMYYRVETSVGPINAVPVQTFWLAPEDNAGIKRAHVEALAEDEARYFQAKALSLVEGDHAKALEMDARRADARVKRAHAEALAEDADRIAQAQTEQVEGWLARHREAGTPRREWSLVEDGRQADHAEALAEQARRDWPTAFDGKGGVIVPGARADRQRRDWMASVMRHDGLTIRQAEQTVRDEAHAEALTLNSHAGKVDGMDNDANRTPAPSCNLCGSNDHSNLTHDLAPQVETATTENHTGSTVVTILEKVWARIREDHPELPEVVIITGSGEGSKWGHFRADSWKIKEEGATIKRHELFLASEALAKGPFQVCQTMLHEAAHTLSRVRGVQDTSRQGRWHNAQFRKAAEEMGLVHKATKAHASHGFAFVTLAESTKARYADLIEELGREIRLTGHLPVWLGGDAEEDDNGGERMTKPKAGEDDKKPHSGSLKATCECPEPIIIRLSRKVLDMGVVRCDDCERLFTHKDGK